MGWVRIDDNFADHPKIIGLSDAAFRLFITGLCYSNRQLTDGIIPYQMVNAWVGDDPSKPSDELEDQNLWERVDKGFRIRSYDEYQPTKQQVEKQRAEARERIKRYRESKSNGNVTVNNRVTDLRPVQPSQPIPTQPIPINITTTSEESDDYLPMAKMPRVASAKLAVQKIIEKLETARKKGVNAWNLSILVQEQWDELYKSEELGACIALTTWYVSELQSRKLNSTEIARIGQMIKRFGRIALLAIDDAATKDLTDLVSYAYRIAQRMYADRKSQ